MSTNRSVSSQPSTRPSTKGQSTDYTKFRCTLRWVKSRGKKSVPVWSSNMLLYSIFEKYLLCLPCLTVKLNLQFHGGRQNSIIGFHTFETNVQPFLNHPISTTGIITNAHSAPPAQSNGAQHRFGRQHSHCGRVASWSRLLFCRRCAQTLRIRLHDYSKSAQEVAP